MSEIASVALPPEADAVAIAEAAGNGAMDGRWYADDRLYVAGVTQAALEAALAQVGTAPPAPARHVSAADFFALWTAAERAALFAVPAMLDAAMGVVLAGKVNLASPRLPALLDAAIALGAIAPDRKARIGAGLPPA